MTVRSSPVLFERRGPLLQPRSFRDTKDPCPVSDGYRWHLFGSGGSSAVERWEILHAVAYELEGPWKELPPATLVGVSGDHVAAPGVVFEQDALHMFVQTEFAALGGSVEYLVSVDGGLTFERRGTALRSDPSIGEATIYDPHPAVVDGRRYVVYSAGTVAGAPDIHLAVSAGDTWEGPWEPLGPILRHEEVPHHNRRDSADYEWGLEGAQLVPLPDGRVLLNAVCFLPEGPRGTRQRVFFAVADDVGGPYQSLGPQLDPTDAGWESGENGHASAFVIGDELVLFYQARESGHATPWRYGVAEFRLAALPIAHLDQRRVGEIELMQMELARR